MIGYDNGFDYRQKDDGRKEAIQYSKLIYPIVKPLRKMKIGILKEAVTLCADEVKNVFHNAVSWLTNNDLMEISEVSYPKHSIAEKIYFPVVAMGAYGCMIKGNGFGPGFPGNQP